MSVLSKTLKRVVVLHLIEYLRRYQLLPPFQSGFRPGRPLLSRPQFFGSCRTFSTVETSLPSFCCIHRRSSARSTTAYGSSGFVVHSVSQMRPTSGSDHTWLAGRTQCIHRDGAVSVSTDVDCGVPQGSVIGPILVILYTADLIGLIQQHDLSHHIRMGTTVRSTVRVARPTLLSCWVVLLRASTRLPAGQARTASSSMSTRQS